MKKLFFGLLLSSVSVLAADSYTVAPRGRLDFTALPRWVLFMK